MAIDLIKQKMEQYKALGITLIPHEVMEEVFEEMEKLQKENLQLRAWKAAYELTYHQLVETEGKLHAASTKADL